MNSLCNRAAWATRSSRRSPSTSRCSERMRRNRRASTSPISRAITATAAAARATMPVVLVRLCTAPRISAKPGGRRLLEGDRERERVVLSVLLAGDLLDRGHDRLRSSAGTRAQGDRAAAVLAGDRLRDRLLTAD